MEWLVVRQCLEGDLCIGLAVELNEDCAQLGSFISLVFILQGCHFLDLFLQFSAVPVNRVDFFAEEFEPMRRPLDFVRPCWVARFTI